jgi:hypothetical protein
MKVKAMATSKDEKQSESDKAATPTTSTKQVFDVSKPGKSAPDASGRPLIIGHRPIVKDPMMNDTTKEEDQKPISTSGKNIVPLNADVSDEEAEPQQDTDKDAEADPKSTENENASSKAEPDTAKETEKAKDTDNKQDETAPEQTEEKSDSKEADSQKSSTKATEQAKSESSSDQTPDEHAGSEDDSAVIVDAVVGQATIKKKGRDAEDEDTAKKAAIEKLIQEKKYFVKISPPNRKRNSKIAVFVLTFLLIFGAVGALLAADAGLVNLGFKPPFDLIQNDTKPADETSADRNNAALNTQTSQSGGTVQGENDWRIMDENEIGVSFMHPPDWTTGVVQSGEQYAYRVYAAFPESEDLFFSVDKVEVSIDEFVSAELTNDRMGPWKLAGEKQVQAVTLSSYEGKKILGTYTHDDSGATSSMASYVLNVGDETYVVNYVFEVHSEEKDIVDVYSKILASLIIKS